MDLATIVGIALTAGFLLYHARTGHWPWDAH
jgi:hypothetical protein